MSTVPEALTAHQCGMAVFSFSLITNLCILSDDVEDGPTAEEVLEIGERRDGFYYDSNVDFDDNLIDNDRGGNRNCNRIQRRQEGRVAGSRGRNDQGNRRQGEQ